MAVVSASAVPDRKIEMGWLANSGGPTIDPAIEKGLE